MKNPFPSGFFGYFLPLTTLLLLGAGTALWMDYQHHQSLIRANELVQVELAKQSLIRDLEQILPSIRVLASERHVQNYIELSSDASRMEMEQGFLSFALYNRLYRTIRFLDLHGHERARIDYQNEKARIVPVSDLQNKSERTHVGEGTRLNAGEVYVSPLDLNMEHGRVEIPYVPTIRIAMPLEDATGRKRGTLMLNYLAEPMLRHFDEMLVQSAGHVALLNAQGHWIRSHRKEREWSFMWGNDISFADAHPGAWKTIASRDKGHVSATDGVFSFTTIYPLTVLSEQSRSSAAGSPSARRPVDPDAYFWKVVSDVPVSIFRTHLRKRVQGTPGKLFIGVWILMALACWQHAVSQRERHSLRRQMELHAKLYENTTEGVMITTPQMKIIGVNQAFTRITGYQESEVLGEMPNILSSGRHDKAFYQSLWRRLHASGNWEGEIVNRRKDGAIFTEWLRISAIRDEHNQVSNYIALFSDISSRKASEQELVRRAYHDPLTGLHNRLAFKERLAQDLARVQRNDKRLAILYIDLDKFKPINDTHGHPVGDEVLQVTANRLRSQVRAMDTIARVGGDEFIVLLGEVDTAQHAQEVAQSLRGKLHEPIAIADLVLQVGASIGLAVFPEDGQDTEALLAHADAAMYREKSSTARS